MTFRKEFDDSQDFVILSRVKDVIPSVNLILDVGAAIGSWATNSRKVWPRAGVIAIEPQDEFVQLLMKSESVDLVHKCVISETCGLVDFNITSDKWSSSMLYEGERKVVVQSRTLECILDSYGKSFESVFIKTDLQGMDLVAVKSLGKYIDQVNGIQMECQMAEYTLGMTGLSERIIEMYRLGFDVYEIFNPLYRPSDGALGQVDVIFLKRNLGCFSNVNW